MKETCKVVVIGESKHLKDCNLEGVEVIVIDTNPAIDKSQIDYSAGIAGAFARMYQYKSVAKKRPAREPKLVVPRQRRNELCDCGSGKKFKYCCHLKPTKAMIAKLKGVPIESLSNQED